MNIISLKVVPLLTQGQMATNAESEVFKDANSKRVDALLHAIDAGCAYTQLKKMFLSAPNKDTVFETEKGTYTGWLDFLQKHSLNRATVDNYIFMYEHKQEFQEMKLISKDPEDLKSGAAGHRKIASIKAVKWYLEKIAIEGEDIRGTLTACDYQKEIQSTVKKVKEDKYILRSEYDKLWAKYTLMELELNKLKEQLTVKQKSKEPTVKELTRANR